MKNTFSKYLALGGVTGPILFTITVSICAYLRPDYRYTQFISELGATNSPNASLMNYVGFMISGLMIISFGVALIMHAKGKLGNIGSVLILLFGTGMFVVGIFSCDVGCPREGTFENTIHDQVSGPAFLSAILGILLCGFSFRKLPSWSGLWLYSGISAVVAFAFMVALATSIEAYTVTGIWQRLLLATIFVWCAISGWKMFRLE